MKLNVKAFALACGIVWGFGIFALAWWIMAFEGATGEVTPVGHLYRGYTISPIGSVIGLVWATVDGAVGGALVAWLYTAAGLKCPLSHHTDATVSERWVDKTKWPCHTI